MNINPTKNIQYWQVNSDNCLPQTGQVITEAPVTLNVNGEDWITVMCTPVDLEALAAGFLFNEGLIESATELASVHVCANGSLVEVWLHHPIDKPTNWRKTTGCTGGITAVQEPLALEQASSNYLRTNPMTITTDKVAGLIERLFESQDLYRHTGGVHTSVLSDGSSINLIAEDIGRHNTLDKLAGKLLLEQSPDKYFILITTGRISSDMLQKAIRLNCQVVISRTSPSSMSVEMAEMAGITLIGYARRTSFRVYTHAQRFMQQIPCENMIRP